MTKIVGAALVILACSSFGFEKARNIEKRKDNIANLKKAFEIMQSEMEFSKKSVCEIFKAVSEVCEDEQIADLFKTSADRAKKSPHEIAKIWKEQTERVKKALCFSETDIAAISQVFNELGKTDYEMQKNVIKYANDTAARLYVAADEDCKKNTKLYRGMGVSVGVFICIILI